MSTKLHHGYRLAEGVDPFAFIVAARTALDPVRDRADARILADRVIDIIDDAAVHGPLTHAGQDLVELVKRPLKAAYNAHGMEQTGLRSTDHRHDPNRLELSIGFDPQSGRHAMLLFAEEATIVEAFRALPQVEEYGYWNNADRPAGVTDTEWEESRAFWGRVLPGYTPPVVALLSWKLRSTNDASMLGLITNRSPLLMEELPDLDQRARRAARSAVLDAAFRDAPDDTTARWSLVHDSMYTARYPEVIDAARALLPHDIDMDLLTGDRPLVVEDTDTKRAVFLGLAAAAGKRLLAPVSDPEED